jgi:hemerythrin-like domain-containing protein
VRKAGGAGAGLIDTLLAQHERGRAITDYVIDRTRSGRIGSGDADPLAKALTAFARMYEAHTAREDTVIFPAFKASLEQKAYHEIGEQFEDIEHQTFGGDGFDIALKQVSDIESRLGLADLGGFTAPAPPTTVSGGSPLTSNHRA